METSMTDDQVIDHVLRTMSDATVASRVRRWSRTPARQFLLYAADLIEHTDRPLPTAPSEMRSAQIARHLSLIPRFPDEPDRA